jgi:hypothetical protein
MSGSSGIIRKTRIKKGNQRRNEEWKAKEGKEEVGHKETGGGEPKLKGKGTSETGSNKNKTRKISRTRV